MKLAFFMAASFCVIVVAPAGAQNFCRFPPVDPRQCLVGDPVGMVYANSVQRIVDITLPTPVGPFEFIRFYDGNATHWALGDQQGLEDGSRTPKPFGPYNEPDLKWWHNYYSFLTVASSETSEPGWLVHSPDGFAHFFNPCTVSGDCVAAISSTIQPSNRAQLRRTGDSLFTFIQEDGTSLVYDGAVAKFVPSPQNGITRYFLTKIVTPLGVTFAAIDYGPPMDESQTAISDCAPAAGAGSAPGAGYIRTITLADGNVLNFYYQQAASSWYPTQECHLGAIKLKDRAGGAETDLARYTTRIQNVMAVVRPFRQPDGTGTYLDTPLSTSYISDGGQVMFRQDGINQSPTAAAAPFEDLTFGLYRHDADSLAPETLACLHPNNVDQIQYPVTDNNTGVGDGTDAGAPLTTTYVSISNPAFVGTGVGYRTKQDAGPAAANWFMNQPTQSEWSCMDAGVPYEPLADLDQRGAWQVFTESPNSLPDGGLFAMAERTQVRSGASTIAGADALLTTNYAYTYGDNNLQHVAQTAQSSVLGGGNATTNSIYDPVVKNRLAATIRQGWTKDATGAVVPRYVGTFYLTRQSCSGSAVDDPLNRTLEVHGPCDVSGTSATDCSGSEPVPITQYTYYPSGSTNTSTRMSKLARYVGTTSATGCASAAHVDTTFDSYDKFGNATATTDPNGVQTTFTYNGDQLTSSTTAGLTTHYSYDDDKLTAVQYPEGNYEVFCYRDGAGCTGNWTNRLQWKAKSSTAAATTWSEKVKFDYWPDGTVRVENYLDSAGNLRRTVHHAANVLRQPTYSKAGDTSPTAFHDLRQFNAAGDVTAIGFGYNNPPDFCGLPGATPSPLCTATNVDRLGRLVSLDQFAAGTTPGFRTNVSYDAQGNVHSIQPGCSTSGGSCTQPSATYAYDDFGNVTSVTAPWLDDGSSGSGTTLFTYDAVDNMLTKKTAAMAAHGDKLTYAYDSLGRLLNVVHNYTTPSSGSETLYSLGYDNSSAPPDLCPPATNALGRMVSRADSFGTTWYQYDAFGRTTAEVRLRAGRLSCHEASPNDDPATFYTYSSNGNLTSVFYPFGRTVTYGYGSIPATDRISSVSVTTFDGTSWTSQSVLSSVIWEPYGGLRGYQILHPGSSTVSTIEYMLGGDGTAAPSACPTSVPSASTSDHTGRLRGLWVSSGTQTPGTATGDLYTRTYTWQADQIVRTDSCALGASVPHTETYGYDALLRLTSAGRPSGGAMADVGGPFDSRSYGYDGRGNRTSQANEDCAYALTYGASGHPDELTQRASTCTAAMLKHSYAYDRDGRVTSKTWAQKLDGSAPYSMLFGSGETDASSNGALDTVLKSVSVNGAVYNYFYDAFNRRRSKVYPTGNTDEFFHSINDELLVDRGLSSVTSPAALPIDQYVWLGGRPVILIRGQMSTSFVLQSDTTASCPRNGEAAACGFYFPITDHIGKPVLMLDANRKVAGIGEYDPFGQLNRVSLDKESPHPYSPTPVATTTLADFKQPVGGSANPSTAISLRALIHLARIKSYTTFGSGTGIHHVPPATSSTATMSLVDADTSTGLWSSSSGGSNFFTSWVQPSAGHAKLNFTTNGWPSCAIGDDPPDFSLCLGGGTFSDDLTGVVMEGYEYRRYQSSAQWFWTPLRFPGQYYDPETDLSQNWNRFKAPDLERYLEPEPELINPQFSLTYASGVYAYSSNNPLANQDPTGLYKVGPAPDCQNWYAALRIAQQIAGCDQDRCSGSGGTCRQRIMKCEGGCDICPILAAGMGPQVDFVDDDPVTDTGECIDGTRGGPVYRDLWGTWHAPINSWLCTDPKMIRVLASTMVHEAMHACGVSNEGGSHIRDSRYQPPFTPIAPGCRASELEVSCSGVKTCALRFK
jgi:RHS repeat-associated protein